MKNILFPTDFSSNAWKALEYVLELYKDEECTFHLLNAFQVSYISTDNVLLPEPGDPAYDLAEVESQTGLQNLLDKLNFNRDNSHHFKSISTCNSLLEAVKQQLKKKHFDFIAMGAKGKSDAAHGLLGDNSIIIMEEINSCPVLVIPEKLLTAPREKKEIVFATNFRTSFIEDEIRVLSNFARHLSAAVRILYIQEKEELSPEQVQHKQELQDYLKDIPHSFHSLTNIKVPVGIHSFIESRGSQMLVILNRKRGFFDSIFTSSIIEEIGRKSHVPILVLHEHSKRN